MSALEKDAWKITFSEVKAAAEDIIEEARKGRMFILVDDEDRENEGDLVIPAQWATPDAINFMAKHARGLICLALTRERVEQLGLKLMAQNNGTRHQTAFTVSIEAKDGISTGISAADRARTVAVAIDVASLATSSACCALIWLRLPWPIAAMRSAQVRSVGKPSSGAAADPKFCRKNQIG